MKTSDFYYDLPKELIAQDPLEDRASSRLMVLDRRSGEISHHVFRDIIDLIDEKDCLVLNNTKVIPARLIGHREGLEGKVEVLLLTRKTDTDWECLVKPGRKCRVGSRIVFGGGLLTGEITEVIDE